MVDANAVQSEYAYLTAGGAQSKAMLPVGVEAKMEKIIRGDATVAETYAAVNEIGLEAQSEMAAMADTKRDLAQKLVAGAVGQGAGAKPAPDDEEGGSAQDKTRHFTEGGNAWDVPVNEIPEFKKDHPNAKAQ